ncbi:acetoin dehydrogenase [Patescibacteria group bacterium]|nr:MAG: acetoin dehydrogenase [Patescibacteria group bacterium]
MRAAVLIAPGKPLEIWDVVLPEPGLGQVRVRLRRSGICGSQLLEVSGSRGEDAYLPHLLGHEGSGTVISVGAGVTKVRPGDRVIISWMTGVGLDAGGLRLTAGTRTVNAGPVATLAEEAIVPENRLVPIPDGVPLPDAALVGCALATGCGIVRNTLQLRAGQSIAVFGAGGIGINVVQMARYSGAGPIIAIDVDQKKLAWAKEFGATEVIDARREDVLGAIYAFSGGGVDAAVATAGSRSSMELALAAVKRGGTAVIAGNLAAGERVSIDPFDLIKGKRLIGTWGGENNPDSDFPFYLDLVRQGALRLKELASHSFPLEAVNEALAALRAGNALRAVVDLAP